MNRAEMIEHILERLDAASGKLSAQWQTGADGTRTRHFLLDDLLPEPLAHEIHAAFPGNAEGFDTWKSFREWKRTSSDLGKLPKVLGDITFALQDPQVIRKIEQITAVSDLEGDPFLYAGGLSMMFKGEFLNPHIDNSHEKTKTRYRRLNLLYYVAPDWREENGGNLELWDDDVKTPVTLVSAFNRLIVMETNRDSWHSVSPVAVAGPRCCVSNYYFSETSPTGDQYYHVTSFTGRPEQRMRRALGVVDNMARNVARHLGARRASDEGYVQGAEDAAGPKS